VKNDVLWMYELLKHVWLRTYAAGAYTTSGVSTDLGGSDDTAINKSTFCVRDDFEVGIHKVRTNGAAAWEMEPEVSLQINT
jgi:hypothetical protein